MAFILSVAIFAYFWAVGYAVVSVLHTRRDLVRNALMAPAVGIVVTLYSTYVFSRLGLPVGKFAHLLALGTLALTALAWIRVRPLMAGRHLVPYVAIALIAFVATGWPLLHHGFAWLGDINPDMTNYVLDAHRLVDQAYIQGPDPAVWRNQTDWVAYYVIFPLIGVRSGSELLLASVITITGMNGLMVYMPLLVTLHVALIAVATGLISTPHRYARVLAAVLMSLSAMLTLGVVLQLIAQVLGLTLLALSVLLCLNGFFRLHGRVLWRFVALVAVVLATFFLGYPEMLTFFGIAFLIYHGLNAGNVRRFLAPAAKSVVVIATMACVLIAPDILLLVGFLVAQVEAGGGTMRHTSLFPFFLVPSGLAALWGLARYVPLQSPWLPGAIVSGGALSVLGVASTAWLGWRGEPAATVTAVMAVTAAPLFLTDNGFATLKLAMYVQPFLLSTMVLALCLVLRVAR